MALHRRQQRAGSRLAAALVCAAFGLAASPARSQQYVPTPDPEHPRVQYADSLISPNDRCIVRQRKLSTGVRPVYVSGVPIAFCCTGCPEHFVLEPERYLSVLNIEVPCAVTHRPAVIDSVHRCYVNHEIYFFADQVAKARFEKNPLKWCGLVTDPISQQRFQPTAKSPQLVYGGRHYYFERKENLAAFQAEPEAHRNRRGG